MLPFHETLYLVQAGLNVHRQHLYQAYRYQVWGECELTNTIHMSKCCMMVTWYQRNAKFEAFTKEFLWHLQHRWPKA